MKTLKNHLILYDAECPLCKTYTKLMVGAGLLEKEGRASYQDTLPEACPMVDRQRAVNEIALVNLETGDVSYGIESLFKVFSAAWPVFRPVFRFRPFVKAMELLYTFISSNRRVIVPADMNIEKSELQPTFRLGYRLAYLVFTWLITAFILSRFTPLLADFLPPGTAYREYLICGGQVLFQGVILTIIARNKTWDYLGNMMTISFCGALLLLPAMLLQPFVHQFTLIYPLWFMGVVGLMFFEHLRRCKLLQLGLTPTITWTLYRILILGMLMLLK